MEFSWIHFAIVAGAIVIGVGSTYIFKKPNNPVEQIAEAVIKEETGMQLDLSPKDSQEDNKQI